MRYPVASSFVIFPFAFYFLKLLQTFILLQIHSCLIKLLSGSPLIFGCIWSCFFCSGNSEISFFPWVPLYLFAPCNHPLHLTVDGERHHVLPVPQLQQEECHAAGHPCGRQIPAQGEQGSLKVRIDKWSLGQASWLIAEKMCPAQGEQGSLKVRIIVKSS